MKAVTVASAGQPFVVSTVDAPGAATPGKVLVRVKAVSLNAADYKTAKFGFPGWSWPHIPGLDFAGTVIGVGEGVSKWREGDDVFGWVPHDGPQGSFAEIILAPALGLTRKPAELSFTDAAALPVAAGTAYYALNKAGAHSGHTVVVLGGSSGVGCFAIQLAVLRGCKVIATASTEKESLVMGLGATHFIDYTKGGIQDKVMALTAGKGADVVIDVIGGNSANEALGLVKLCGQIAFITGFPNFANYQPFSKGISAHEILLGLFHKSEELAASLEEIGNHLASLVVQGKLKTTAQPPISINDLPAALVKMSQGHTTGKIVASL
ncbi:zinc-binding dehydrogenase [Pelomyxa schiedti]|nr:zinc-binding dehydrogenase [Pelomyxa schiedti]